MTEEHGARRRVDVVAVGTPAGLAGARHAAATGASVLVVDAVDAGRLTEIGLGPDGAVDHVVVERADGSVERIGTRAVFVGSHDVADDRGGAAYATTTPSLLWWTARHGGCVIDRTGGRFADETLTCRGLNAAVEARPGATGWLVYDRRVHDLCRPFTDGQRPGGLGTETWADTPGGLAERLGLPAVAVEHALAEIASSGLTGRPDRFGRTFERSLSGPLAAVEVAPTPGQLRSGLRVDGHARVHASDGRHVPGLYAFANPADDHDLVAATESAVLAADEVVRSRRS